MNKAKICCIFNYPPHYRKAVYIMMDKELGCDFYFGDKVPGSLREMDCSLLSGYRKRFRNVVLKSRIIWQSGIFRLLIKPYEYYIMTVDTACLSGWIFIFFAMLFGKKIYFWTHGYSGKESFFEKLKKKVYYFPSAALLLYSEYAKNLMLKEGFDGNKLFVIANSLDYDRQLEIRKKLLKTSLYYRRFQNRNSVILFIGRLEPKKKLDKIIDLQKELKNKGKEINLVFIGDGSDKIRLESKAEKLCLRDKIWFAGECYNEEEIGNHIYNADLCLSPGNVGLTAIHSLTYGTPVITHNDFSEQMPEFESITEGKTGSYFIRNDYVDMLYCVERWLREHPIKDQSTINACMSIVDSKYNPYFQIQVLKKALQL
jgi:glycosyltransferase involved in cell wall biosynthesis